MTYSLARLWRMGESPGPCGCEMGGAELAVTPEIPEARPEVCGGVWDRENCTLKRIFIEKKTYLDC